MPKYIRVFNRVFKFDDYCSIEGNNLVKTIGGHKIYFEIYQMSDNLSDLCEVFVVCTENINDYKPKVWLKDYKEALDYLKQNKGVNIFGAIWIVGDRGEPLMKPVVVLKDNGELLPIYPLTTEDSGVTCILRGRKYYL